MKVAIVVAMDKNRVIGKNNQLPWHLPADLKHFKSITMGKPIIMGRKTYESIGRPLPGRRNIVITRQASYAVEGCDVVHSIDQALSLVKNEKQVMIIGGEKIFRQTIDRVDDIYLTIIETEVDGDSHFPKWNANDWQILSEEKHQSDEKNQFSYRFLHLTRASSKTT